MIQNFFLKMDMFQQKFTFQFGKSNIQNSTCFGGFLSVIITIFGVIYLGYMLNLYFGNKILPKITLFSQTCQDQQEIQLQFEQSPILFKLELNGFSVSDFYAITGKNYLNIDVYFVEDGLNYTNQYIIPTQDCANVYPGWKGFTCLDFNNANDKIKQLVYSNNIQTSYQIHFSSCEGQKNCSSKEETMNILTNQDTTFTFYLNTQQFNYTSSEFQQNLLMESYQFDDLLVFQGEIYFQKMTSYIQKGMMFQNKYQKDHVANYDRQDYFLSRNNIYQKIGFDAYGQLTFQVDQNFSQQEFQFPMITEVLSQFFSMISIFMAIGVIASKFSKNLMLQHLCILHLKEQFKCTAAQIIQRNQINQPNKNNNNNNSFIDEVINLQEKINKTDFLDRNKHISIYLKLKKIFLKVFRVNCSNQNQEYKLNQKIMDYTLEQLDILQMYKQLIKLNMAVKLILTKDQYAALQFCGCNLDNDIDGLKIKSCLENKQKNQIEQKQDKYNQVNTKQNINDYHFKNQQENQEILNDVCKSPQNQEKTVLKDIQQTSSNQINQFDLSKSYILDKHHKQKDNMNKNQQSKNIELLSNQFDKSVEQELQLFESNQFKFQDENYSKSQVQIDKDQINQTLSINNQIKSENASRMPATILKLNFLQSYIRSRDQEFKGDESLQTYDKEDKVIEGVNTEQMDFKNIIKNIKNNQKICQNQIDQEGKCNDVEKRIDLSNFKEQEHQITNKRVKQVSKKHQNEKINFPIISSQVDKANLETQLNHIEELNKLDKDELLLKQEFFKFITKFECNNTIISTIDKNIQNSLLTNWIHHKY
ncbi:transmembrane protein, putative (macronuclear) [Tetrahymena thermophila SB210]|uniref:Transmembrane protein, putative n=1 Tax=Tetrahymena thermophila (strain SB210) TaxID=312017 RepID=I7LVD8_TETTS|nr:transmembrane protein, putative [Tetrahymena thermophila SB210]EAR97936.2 transmembrane protein, putative [Tetrahymena thermophila SB210]|eukprot:XP_001018181.2 transmembrane protein, putative [Tetrahymena thermophila SB210]